MTVKFGQVIRRVDANGRRIVVRRIRKNEDPRNLLGFINTIISEGSRIGSQKKFTLKQEREWIKKSIGENKKGNSINIFLESQGKIVGSGALFGREKGAIGHIAEFGIIISKPLRRSGLATIIFKELAKLGKREWKLEIVKSMYFSGNNASRRLHRKLGFKRVGKIPKGAKFNGRYEGLIIVYREV